MTDLVSRKAVLDTLDKMDKALDTDRTIENYKGLLTECYKDLTPVISEHDWVPIKKRLPEKEVQVLIYCKNKTYQLAVYYEDEFELNGCKDKGFDTGRNVIYLGNVLAWMPLPEAYKGGGKK